MATNDNKPARLFRDSMPMLWDLPELGQDPSSMSWLDTIEHFGIDHETACRLESEMNATDDMETRWSGIVISVDLAALRLGSRSR